MAANSVWDSIHSRYTGLRVHLKCHVNDEMLSHGCQTLLNPSPHEVHTIIHQQ